MEENQVILEKMRTVLENRINQLIVKNDKNIAIDDIKYAGKMEVSEKDENGNIKTVEKDIFIIIEKNNDGTIIQKYYDEDKNFLGMFNNGEMMLSKKMTTVEEGKRNELKKQLGELDNNGKNLKQLTEDNKNKEDEDKKKIQNDLINAGKVQEDYEISEFREIIDPEFEKAYPETFKGATRKGIAYSEKYKEFICVADYGNDFEMAKGSEPSKAQTRPVTHICRADDSIEEQEPHSFINLKENNDNNKKTGIGVRRGQYGYLEFTSDEEIYGKWISKDVRTKGEDANKNIGKEEKRESTSAGVSYEQLEAGLLKGEKNALFYDIVNTVVEDPEINDILEDLLSRDEEKTSYVSHELEKIISSGNVQANDGDTLKGILINSLKNQIMTDYTNVYRTRFNQ